MKKEILFFSLILILSLSLVSAVDFNSKCSDCGKGLFNFCDRAECLGLGNCKAKPVFFRVLCLPEEEIEGHHSGYGGAYYKPDYNSEHFKQWRQRNPGAPAEWYNGIERPGVPSNSFEGYYDSRITARNIKVESPFSQLPREETERRYNATYGHEPDYSLMPQYMKENNFPWMALKWQPEYGPSDGWGKRILGEEKIAPGTNKLMEPLNQTFINNAIEFQNSVQPTVEQAIAIGYIPPDYIAPPNLETYEPNYVLPGLPVSQHEIDSGFELTPDYKYELINETHGYSEGQCLLSNKPFYYSHGSLISNCELCGCSRSDEICVNDMCVVNNEFEELEEEGYSEEPEEEINELEEEKSLSNDLISLILPLNNTIFYHNESDSLDREYIRIYFNWSFLNEGYVDYYVFAVDSDYGHGEVNVSSTNRSGKYTGIGEFKWKVKACNSLDCSDWSGQKSLMVYPFD